MFDVADDVSPAPGRSATAASSGMPLAGHGPTGGGGWELQITPAAALSVQQAVPRFYQLIANYPLSSGYYPLAPWAGLAVECGGAAAALALAYYLLRRRDA